MEISLLSKSPIRHADFSKQIYVLFFRHKFYFLNPDVYHGNMFWISNIISMIYEQLIFN